jgi:hypothetical protein
MTPVSKARRRFCLALTVATASLGTTALATSAAASATEAGPTIVSAHPAHPAASNAVAGYAWVDGGNVESYYDFNSANGHATAVTASSPSTGDYQVEFANMSGIASSVGVQVTPYSTARTCAASGWEADGTKLRVVVDCYDFSGALSDGNFNVIVTHPTIAPHGVFDYALDYEPNASGTLITNQYNSSHKKNSVKHLGTGRYQLLFGGPKTTGTQGIAHVTPVGAQSGNCELVSWTGSAKGELVNVDCFAAGPGHAPQNRKFIVTYATSSSLMGINGQVVANAFANGKAPLYAPNVQFSSKRGAKVSVVHYRTGEYGVLAVGSGGNAVKWGGDVQANAVGTRGQLCISGGWGTGITPSLSVNCYDKSGNLADASFTVEWVVP